MNERYEKDLHSFCRLTSGEHEFELLDTDYVPMMKQTVYTYHCIACRKKTYKVVKDRQNLIRRGVK